MTYQNPTELKQLLQKLQTHAKKGLGQNFLQNPEIVQKIITAAELKSSDDVLEIGPGPGFLTQFLIDQCQSLTAIELDTTFVLYLKKHFANRPNFTILNEDALQFQPQQQYKIIANIPYYITSPLIRHFLNQTSAHKPTLMVLLIQLEVAQKICSKAGDHSMLSLLIQNYGQPKLVCKVSPGNFYPAPKVDSAIISITPHTQPIIQDTEIFEKIISAAFHQKRKTLENTLAQGLSIDKVSSQKLLLEAKILPNARPQHLTLLEWQSLIEVIKNR